MYFKKALSGCGGTTSKNKIKNIFFFIEKSNELKYLSPIIYFFKKKKLEIKICFVKRSETKNDFKKYLRPQKAQSSLLKKIRLKEFNDEIEFHNFCINETDNISYIFSLHFISKERFKISKEFLQSITSKWCVIGHGIDSFSQFKDEDTFFNYKANFFFSSKFLLSEGKKYIQKFVKKKNIFNTKNVKIYLVGNSMFSSKIFKKKQKKIKRLIYLPFPFLRNRYGKNKNFAFQAAYSGQFINFFNFSKNSQKKGYYFSINSQVKHFILNKIEIFKYFDSIKNYYYIYNELNVVKSIRKFCDENNFKFIVKPRLKFPYIDIINKYADEVIFDNESLQYPSLFQKELSTADLVIGSLSSSVYEVAMFKIPYINIEIPKIAFKSKSNKFMHNYEKNLYYNYDKVIFNYKINDFINKFKDEKLKKFNLNKKKSDLYIKKFCGLSKNPEEIGKKIFGILKLGNK